MSSDAVEVRATQEFVLAALRLKRDFGASTDDLIGLLQMLDDPESMRRTVQRMDAFKRGDT